MSRIESLFVLFSFLVPLNYFLQPFLYVPPIFHIPSCDRWIITRGIAQRFEKLTSLPGELCPMSEQTRGCQFILCGAVQPFSRWTLCSSLWCSLSWENSDGELPVHPLQGNPTMRPLNTLQSLLKTLPWPLLAHVLGLASQPEVVYLGRVKSRQPPV